MKKHRIFVALNTDNQLKRKMLNWQEKWPNLEARWTKEDSLHLTLVFIGQATDEELVEVCQIAKAVGKNHDCFNIDMDRVCYGPPKGQPRMIWAQGPINEALVNLKNDLDDHLSSNFLKKENRPFRPHITLARLKNNKNLPEIEESVDWHFPVDSIEVIKSKLQKNGARYTVLESVQLGI